MTTKVKSTAFIFIQKQEHLSDILSIITFYYVNWSALQELPPLRKTVSPQVKNYDNFSRVLEVANKLLMHHLLYLAPWMNDTLFLKGELSRC